MHRTGQLTWCRVCFWWYSTIAGQSGVSDNHEAWLVFFYKVNAYLVIAAVLDLWPLHKIPWEHCGQPMLAGQTDSWEPKKREENQTKPRMTKIAVLWIEWSDLSYWKEIAISHILDFVEWDSKMLYIIGCTTCQWVPRRINFWSKCFYCLNEIPPYCSLGNWVLISFIC